MSVPLYNEIPELLRILVEEILDISFLTNLLSRESRLEGELSLRKRLLIFLITTVSISCCAFGSRLSSGSNVLAILLYRGNPHHVSCSHRRASSARPRGLLGIERRALARRRGKVRRQSLVQS